LTLMIVKVVASSLGSAAFSAVAMVTLAASAGSGQITTLIGMVRDSARNGIAGADVGIPRLQLSTRTDSLGRFMMRGVPVGRVGLSVRRLGFEPSVFEVDVPSDGKDTLALILDVKAVSLDATVVGATELKQMIALEEFYRRSVRGGGWFVRRADIEARRSSYLSDVLRGIAGIRVVRLPRGNGSTVRFVSSGSSRRDCPPVFWVDGQRVENFELDDLPPRDVEGIELYQGPSTTPAQFANNAGARYCGAVIIWTRVPGT
jgi:hypothetical protein